MELKTMDTLLHKALLVETISALFSGDNSATKTKDDINGTSHFHHHIKQ